MAPPAERRLTASRVVGAAAVAALAVGVSYVAALLIASGLNFGYDLHPQYLAGSFPVSAVGIGLVAGALALVRVGRTRFRLVLGTATVAACFVAVILMVEFEGMSREETERRNAPLLNEIAPLPGVRAGAIHTYPVHPKRIRSQRKRNGVRSSMFHAAVRRMLG